MGDPFSFSLMTSRFIMALWKSKGRSPLPGTRCIFCLPASVIMVAAVDRYFSVDQEQLWKAVLRGVALFQWLWHTG